jgi:SAM-dependent methyltransferase
MRSDRAGKNSHGIADSSENTEGYVKKYLLPGAIPSNMGGDYNTPDNRMIGVIELLECASIDHATTVLDVGMGRGQLSKWFSEKGKKVTGTGINIDSYDMDYKTLRDKYHIEIVDCFADDMPFEDNSFNIILMSHILEHVSNVGNTLKEVRRVLDENGTLLLFVPPHTDYVCAGHISMGWNIGQLMYVLLINGFDVKNGSFAEHKGSVCAFVKKSRLELPLLRGDRGDIHILNLNGFWPLDVRSSDLNDGFIGKIKAVNWKQINIFKSKSKSLKRIIYERCAPLLKIIPLRLRIYIGVALIESTGSVNPKYLK